MYVCVSMCMYVLWVVTGRSVYVCVRVSVAYMRMYIC
jgi:hypothetical protein